jgi:ABC-type antimicrobial peptide transport system permease subunit
MSLAACAFIVLWVQDEKSFDRFHNNASTIYMAVSNFKINDNEQYVPLSPGLIGPTAKEDFPAVEDFCRVRNWDIGYLKYEDVKTSSIFCYYADSTFFSFFNFPIIKGNRNNPLRNPNDVVVSERLAAELFGKEDPVGKIILLDDGRPAHVTAVMKNFPKNTYLNWGSVDLVSSFGIDPASLSNQVMNIWEGTEFFSFIRVKPGTDIASITQHLHGKQAEMWQTFRWFLLQPMVDLHLYTLDGQPAGIKTVRLFQWIALIIFVIACINYVNLVTARASKRQREIGLKKVIGAKKRQLFLQLTGEAVILFIVAIIVALLLNLMLLPVFNSLSGKEITFRLFDANIWLVYITMLVAVVALAGMYPAYLLASFKASTVVQAVQTKRGSNFFRKALVVTQFVASTALIAGTIVIAAQMKYMRDKDMGYDREQVLMCPMVNMSGHYNAVKAELEQQASISAITAASDNIMDVMSGNGFGNWEDKTDVNAALMHFEMRVDTSFLRVMRLTLVAGANFTSASNRQYILNEAAVKLMGMTDPVGKWVEQYDTRITGVVKDFHFRSLHHEIGPFVMYYEPDRLSHLYVRTRPGNAQQAIAAVEKLWKQYNPDYAFTYNFMDDTFNRMYVSEIRTNRLFGIFSIIAILISCLGLLGLVVFSAELKTKEIGIRKVLGASLLNIVKLLTREFLILVGISILIALPLAYWWLDSMLRNFAYRISVGWRMFALAGLITIVLTLLTVGFQAVKAAMANPVKAIKTE